MTDHSCIILASGSPSRAAILEQAGIAFKVVAAKVDEDRAKKDAFANGLSPLRIALKLAQLKAQSVSILFPEYFVLGGDQILVFQGRVFNKPKDMRAARETLWKLRGQSHTLISAAVIFKSGDQILEVVDEACLTMRNFSDDYLDSYLENAGDKILTSVGAYQLEAEGADLFEVVEGDFNTILGLPMNSLEEFFREKGFVKGQ